MVYKELHELSNTEFGFRANDDIHSHNTRGKMLLHTTAHHTNYHCQSISYTGPKLYNIIPTEIKILCQAMDLKPNLKTGCQEEI